MPHANMQLYQKFLGQNIFGAYHSEKLANCQKLKNHTHLMADLSPEFSFVEPSFARNLALHGKTNSRKSQKISIFQYQWTINIKGMSEACIALHCIVAFYLFDHYELWSKSDFHVRMLIMSSSVYTLYRARDNTNTNKIRSGLNLPLLEKNCI